MNDKFFTFNTPISETELIATAKHAIAERLIGSPVFTSPKNVRDFLMLEFANQEVEQFYVLFLDAQHLLLRMEMLFQGTIDGATVYPREVIRSVIQHNAAAVILAHNHPSGHAEPSSADTAMTTRIQNALALIDVRVLDHLVVGGDSVISFAERGLL